MPTLSEADVCQLNCAPAMLAVHVAPVHEPLGAIVNVVPAVTSPRLLLNASNASVANAAWLPLAAIAVLAGLMVM